jgi:hypothetical protein
MLGKEGTVKSKPPEPPEIPAPGTPQTSTSAMEAVKFMMIEMPRRMPLLWAATTFLQLVLGTNIALAAYLIKWIVEALTPFDVACGTGQGGEYLPVIQAFSVYGGVSLLMPLNGLFFAYASSTLIPTAR